MTTGKSTLPRQLREMQRPQAVTKIPMGIVMLALKPERLVFKPVFPLNEKITKPRLSGIRPIGLRVRYSPITNGRYFNFLF